MGGHRCVNTKIFQARRLDNSNHLGFVRYVDLNMFFPCIYFVFSLKPDKRLRFWFSFQNYVQFWFRKCLQIKEMPQLDHLLCLTFYIHWRETEIMFCENLGMTKSWENPWLAKLVCTNWQIGQFWEFNRVSNIESDKSWS